MSDSVNIRRGIALIGFMGVGKTTVARRLSRLLGIPATETDAMVVEMEGMPITDIFARYGEPYFRKCETEAILSLEEGGPRVVSCGGGAVMRQENVDNLKKSSHIVLLTARPQTILARVKDSTDRPILNGHMEVDYIRDLMEKRREKYEAAADLVVATDGKTVEEICKELLDKVQKLEEKE